VIAAVLAEGSSDKALLPILRWVLASATPAEIRAEWIDAYDFSPRPASLRDKVQAARRFGPYDLFFVHRDADKPDPEWRYREIEGAVGDLAHVAVVPIRATEAWLLLDSTMIRVAAGRPSGTEPLDLPLASKVESESDPKSRLHAALAARPRRHFWSTETRPCSWMILSLASSGAPERSFSSTLYMPVIVSLGARLDGICGGRRGIRRVRGSGRGWRRRTRATGTGRSSGSCCNAGRCRRRACRRQPGST